MLSSALATIVSDASAVVTSVGNYVSEVASAIASTL